MKTLLLLYVTFFVQIVEASPVTSVKLQLNPAQDLHYVFSGDITKPALLFIHGTPGKWTNFSDYLLDPKLQKRFFMVAMDRLGWGESLHDPNKAIVDFKTQISAVTKVMDQYQDKKWIVIGHSYGASLAPAVLAKEAARVKSIVMLAGNVNPKLYKKWYNTIGDQFWLYWALPNSLKKSNNEIMALKKELKSLEKQISQKIWLQKIIVIQGLKDKLVSPKNIKYIRAMWSVYMPKLQIVELKNAGHFLPWENEDEIKKFLLSF